jgi:hypothetical protein|tara:strand:- start:638 stop:919 length:282 start_codon:yes stop_codon:yes gene_type:complete
MSMRDDILQILSDNEWHCAGELYELGVSARNRISEIRQDLGEDYILGGEGTPCKIPGHYHKAKNLCMYKLNDQEKKQELINRLDNAIQLELNV